MNQGEGRDRLSQAGAANGDVLAFNENLHSRLLQSILHQASDFEDSPELGLALFLQLSKPVMMGAQPRSLRPSMVTWPMPCCSQCLLGRLFNTRNSTNLSPLLRMCAPMPHLSPPAFLRGLWAHIQRPPWQSLHP